jgi:hypothetical protein
MISIVYAVPVGGQREHQFNSGADCARHMEQNNANLFKRVPQPSDPECANKLAKQRADGWDMTAFLDSQRNKR